jgi:hemerythrin superfamily protein
MTDVITIIKQDHRQLDQTFASYKKASDAAEKDRLVKDMTSALAKHAAAEEILVYPALRRAEGAGHEAAEEAIDEHQQIKRILADLDGLAGDDRQQKAKVTELERAVKHHVQEEEKELLPKLAAATEPRRLDQMGSAFERMKPLLPTRAHPNVPGTSSAQLLAGPLASMADHIRDLLAR